MVPFDVAPVTTTTLPATMFVVMPWDPLHRRHVEWHHI
jgi:hypothetical protein